MTEVEVKLDKSDSLHNRIVCNLLGTIYDLWQLGDEADEAASRRWWDGRLEMRMRINGTLNVDR